MLLCGIKRPHLPVARPQSLVLLYANLQHSLRQPCMRLLLQPIITSVQAVSIAVLECWNFQPMAFSAHQQSSPCQPCTLASPTHTQELAGCVTSAVVKQACLISLGVQHS